MAAGETVATTKEEVFEKFLALMITATGFGANNVFLSMDSEPPDGTKKDTLMIISPGGGYFDEGAFAGGGGNTLFYHGSAIVTLFNRVKLDRSGHDLQALTEDTRGLFVLEKNVIKSIVNGNPLKNDSDEEILIDYMQPLSDHDPRKSHANPPENALQLQFNLDFMWDLS